MRTGIAAADPDLLPVGSVIQVERLGDRYNGIYTVMDTGPAVQGRHIDIYMWSCNEALELGRRARGITVLRLGWNPQASTPDARRSAVPAARGRAAAAGACRPSSPMTDPDRCRRRKERSGRLAYCRTRALDSALRAPLLSALS